MASQGQGEAEAQAQVSQEKGKRGPKAKAGTGCARCKKSHQKCDGQKPVCMRCLRAGAECVYLPPKGAERSLRQLLPAASTLAQSPSPSSSSYSPSVASSSASASASGSNTPISTSVSVVPAPLLLQSSSQLLPKSSQLLSRQLDSGEVLYFDRFRDEVASRMSSQTEGPSEFWLRSVLRESAADECILDMVIAIGALTHAKDENDARNSPLYSQFMAGSALSHHYREAIQHYTRAIATLRTRLRGRISSEDSPQDEESTPSRTILIVTILFSLFESMQGNAAAADRLIAQGLNLLKDVIMQKAELTSGHPSEIASLVDDQGIQEAEFFLIRTATWNMTYSPMNPHQRDSIQGLSQTHTHHLPDPDPELNEKDFCAAYWRAVTISSVWSAKVQTIAPGASPEVTEQLRQESDSIQKQLIDWQAAAAKRLAAAPTASEDQSLYYELAQVWSGSFVLRTILRCDHDLTGAEWDASEEDSLIILGQYQAAVHFRDISSYPRSIIFDALLSGVSKLAQASRIQKVRYGALDVWKQLVSRETGWDLKGVYMATSALVEAEEVSRDENGHIPYSARYTWSAGHWNTEHTQFYVTFTAQHSETGTEPQVKNLMLRPEDYNLA